MSKSKSIVIVSVLVIIALIVFYKRKKKKIDLPVYDECNPVPESDKPTINEQTTTNIVYEECGGLTGWFTCFPLKKGIKDGEGFMGSHWVANLQKYLGLNQDGYFGDNTEIAVNGAIGENVVDWWQYRNLKEAYQRLNPEEKNLTVNIQESK